MPIFATINRPSDRVPVERRRTPRPVPILGPLDGPTHGRRFAHEQSGVTGHLGGPEWRSYTPRSER